MLEFFLLPLTVGAAAVAFGRRRQGDYERDIETAFKHLKVGTTVRGEHVYPKLVAKEKKDLYTRYVYRVPLGLTKKTLEPVKEVLEATLDRYVEVTFKKWLYIDVFHHAMPGKVMYKDVPDQKGWVIPLGLNEKGWHFHDFDKTPHCTISGTTRFGKTVMLKNIMTYLIEHHPDDVSFVILDMKGELEFGRYANLKQVDNVASSPQEAFESLQRVKVLMEQKEAVFKANGWSNVSHSPVKERLFIIVDEGAQLAPDRFMSKEERNMLLECQHILGEVARIGGALGFRLIFCTQYPTSDTLPRQVKQNADLKITFRLPTGYASQVAIDDYGAEELPSDIKGRAIVKTHEKMIVQTPLIDDDEMMKRLEVYRVGKVERREADRKTVEDTIHFE
ncbi:FtsK/SpoIIIE domain-containing protein [Geobacillus thermoleovorans]|uniref:FtsK/SpoIIIE domain-containing protein n=1 Tax=Geobacillus thermoleovorans TaxID=33941 RepID=UPI0009BE0C95|nr:FtsK/SpoIIIE domain-containing protein [Geobacillus thermoleovorans]OQP13135.1 cell division protein FtsK [Geobacillus thermoleovorans]